MVIELAFYTNASLDSKEKGRVYAYRMSTNVQLIFNLNFLYVNSVINFVRHLNLNLK